ncbi:hypothetical protein GGP41_007522 [Bipolaris sorokiniana]|uniref:SWIM-type domain-containing protein n=2 Tax=Cochliobolus sativus TaxID=45130 RepID=A0A8H6DQP6_COCSA|nr:uncharacterized protein COCSADRAFT_293614 [Bipolaris sorokiniana ND90Pr]EMD67822.1 hypothetical protein COCSADRAFT_293614 [Bipolaris sorokiniana ND90Pr]KAF5844472.1 hypothetical protein GGP41_007522 [Bipolaris sorokiniana]
MTLVLPFLASPAPCCCCCKARVNGPCKHVYLAVNASCSTPAPLPSTHTHPTIRPSSWPHHDAPKSVRLKRQLHNLSWPDSPLVRQPACSFSAFGINIHPIGCHHVTTTAPPRCCRPLDTDSLPAEEIPSPTASTILTLESLEPCISFLRVMLLMTTTPHRR